MLASPQLQQPLICGLLLGKRLPQRLGRCLIDGRHQLLHGGEHAILNFFGVPLRLGVLHLAGKLAVARGDTAGGIAALEQAKKHEDELLYDEPPAWYHPMRQELGAVRLAMGQAAAAEKLFREDLVHFPNNGWSLYGLARSLEAQSKGAEAAKVDAEYRKWWEKADVKPLAVAK